MNKQSKEHNELNQIKIFKSTDTNSNFLNFMLVVIVGEASVGKTCLLHRFTRNSLPEEDVPTIGIEFGTKTVKIDGE